MWIADTTIIRETQITLILPSSYESDFTGYVTVKGINGRDYLFDCMGLPPRKADDLYRLLIEEESTTQVFCSMNAYRYKESTR